jgi:hypothetical protein
MKSRIRSIVAILLAGVWINVSEFARGWFLRDVWMNHYQSLGVPFPASVLNTIVWVVWGFSLALVVYVLSRKFTLALTTLLTWLVAYVMMWLVLWNLRVLPPGILLYAIPLTFLEAFVASFICYKVARTPVS